MHPSSAMIERLRASAQAWTADLTAWRRHLHMHPEISFSESDTTEWLANRMEEWGISYARPTPTGLVGEICGNRPGSTVAIRADIDALPIQEATEVDFRSQNPGAMHACGHDGHTAILLGVARFFAANREFPGRVKLLFQPAEERPPGGALPFVEAGVLDDVDACIGLHLMSDIPTGRAGITEGPMTANSDSFTARIQGHGGHGSTPHRCVDAVLVGCHAVMNLQTIVSRKVDPRRTAVITVGAIHAGTTFNVIAHTAELKGTVRSFHEDVRTLLHDEIKRTLEATCAMHGATVELQTQMGYPACINHPEITEIMRGAARDVLGANAVHLQEPQTGGEDFAYYARKVPAAFLFLGCRNAAVGAVYDHHHPNFAIDEAALPLGMEILAQAVLRLVQ